MSRGSKARLALAILRPDAAADAAGVATVEDHGEMDALVESGVEDARHLAVANVVAAFVSVGGHQRAVGVHILAVHEHGELVALAVDAQRAVAGVVKDHGVAPLRHVHEILLHGGENAVVRGLAGGQETTPGRGWGGAGSVSRTTWLAGKPNLGLVSRSAMACASLTEPSRFWKAAQLAAAVDAAGRMLRRRACGLVGVDADEQRALGLRDGQRRGERANQGRQRGNSRLSCSLPRVQIASGALRLPRSCTADHRRAWLIARGRPRGSWPPKSAALEDRSTSYRWNPATRW